MKWRSSQQLEVALTCESTNSGMSCHKDVNFQVSEASTNAKFIYSTGKQNSSLLCTGSTLLNVDENPPAFSTVLSNAG